MNNWRESRFKAVCRVFSFCCGPTGPLVVIKGRMAVCGDAWSRTTLLKNQLLSFAKLSFALYPCRAWHPRLARRSSQTASTCQSSILKTQSKNLYESGDAWSRTTLALISYAFCALSVPRPASPFVKAIFTDSLNILSNTNMVKVKDEKIFPSHAWALRVLLL